MTQPRWIDTFHDLHAASSVEELWSVLLSWHGIRSSTLWEEPYVLFREFHAEQTDGALATAALLCTDHRWRKASHLLVVRLVESDVLSDTEVEELAEWFVGGAIGVEVEVTEPAAVEVMAADQLVDGGGDEPKEGGGAAAHGMIERPIWPALRRWGSALLVTRDPGRWRGLLDAAKALPSRDGDALAAGVMDASAHIPTRDRSDALAEGLAWGSGIVRLAALPGLAAVRGSEAALARAAGDPSAKVRAWTPKKDRSLARSNPASPGEDQRSGTDATGHARLF